AAFTPAGANMVVGGEPGRVDGAEASADFFRTLGVAPLLGRTFTAEEQAAGAPVVVVGHGFWRERLGGRADAVGTTLLLDGVAREVIGVLPPVAMLPADAEVWTPLRLDLPDWRTRRGITWLQVVGRLRPEVELVAVRAEAGALSA